jgi:hypothetical protein
MEAHELDTLCHSIAGWAHQINVVVTHRSTHVRELRLTDLRDGFGMEMEINTSDRRHDDDDSFNLILRGDPDILQVMLPQTPGEWHMPYTVRNMNYDIMGTSEGVDDDPTDWTLTLFSIPTDYPTLHIHLFKQIIEDYFNMRQPHTDPCRVPCRHTPRRHEGRHPVAVTQMPYVTRQVPRLDRRGGFSRRDFYP